MKFHAKHARWFAYLLHLLMPGLGHVLWREFLFGAFIYLIMLIATALFFVGFFVPFGWPTRVALFGMPTLFYVFTFFDLARTIRARHPTYQPPVRLAQILVLVGAAYFFLAPIAPGNFLLRNAPTLHTIDDTSVSPVYSPGDLTLVNRLSYSADLFFLARPVVYALPDRFEIVRIRLAERRLINAFMLGRPGELVEVVDGTVFVNGVAESPPTSFGPPLRGDWPLTPVEPGSILVATIQHGALTRVHEVPLSALAGRVTRIL